MSTARGTIVDSDFSPNPANLRRNYEQLKEKLFKRQPDILMIEDSVGDQGIEVTVTSQHSLTEMKIALQEEAAIHGLEWRPDKPVERRCLLSVHPRERDFL